MRLFIVATSAAAAALAGCGGWPPDDEFAGNFLAENRPALEAVVGIAKEGRVPRRIDVKDLSDQAECEGDAACLKRTDRIVFQLKRMNIGVFSSDLQCLSKDVCSLSFTIRSRGLGVSGSGTTLIYDENPDWGAYRIVPLNGRSGPWYYGHLGD